MFDLLKLLQPRAGIAEILLNDGTQNNINSWKQNRERYGIKCHLPFGIEYLGLEQKHVKAFVPIHIYRIAIKNEI